MDQNNHNTQIFEKQKLEQERIKGALKIVYNALKEKGYNPIDQIIGYILSGDPTYITSHDNARSIIQDIERDELLSEMLKVYLEEVWDGKSISILHIKYVPIILWGVVMNRILGLDIGDKWIGVAITDELRLIAQPLKTIKRISNKVAYEEIYEIIKEHDIKDVVVGLPKNMNNTLGTQGEKVIKFAEKLKNKYRINLIYEDERMTTLMAEKVLIEGSVRRENRKKYIDKIAATYILKSYIDRIWIGEL